MGANRKDKKTKPYLNILFRIGVCLTIIAIGVIGMSRLASMKTAPAESPVEERRLRVEITEVHPTSVPFMISGYGEVRVLNEVKIAPEVSGKVVAVHPLLEVGEIIPAGDILFEIDNINYQATLNESKAAVTQWQTTINRLKKQSAIDTMRLKTLKRNRDLAKAEFERARVLFEVDKVGTRSGVERTEQAYNAVIDQVDQLVQAVSLYPMRIQEAQSSLVAAKARREVANANLNRCRVETAFTGRIKSTNIELGQYVTPGQPVITLADDTLLEIQVPLDSRDARRWLRFKTVDNGIQNAWFSGLEELPCSIHWTEDTEGHTWKGSLHRVVAFNTSTRTITIAIRVKAPAAQKTNPGQLPLVDGMFCEVRIPGKTLHDVYQLPRNAVNFNKTVYVSVNDRLKTVPVTIIRADNTFAYISEGLHPGDKVITTRLVDPLENTLLDVIPADNQPDQSGETS